MRKKCFPIEPFPPPLRLHVVFCVHRVVLLIKARLNLSVCQSQIDHWSQHKCHTFLCLSSTGLSTDRADKRTTIQLRNLLRWGLDNSSHSSFSSVCILSLHPLLFVRTLSFLRFPSDPVILCFFQYFHCLLQPNFLSCGHTNLVLFSVLFWFVIYWK